MAVLAVLTGQSTPAAAPESRPRGGAYGSWPCGGLGGPARPEAGDYIEYCSKVCATLLLISFTLISMCTYIIMRTNGFVNVRTSARLVPCHE
jgi:hypothetical protein